MNLLGRIEDDILVGTVNLQRHCVCRVSKLFGVTTRNKARWLCMYIPSAVTASLQFWLFMVHNNPHYRSPTSCGTVHPDNQTIQPSVLWDLERLNDIFKRTIYPLVRIWIFEKVTTAHMCEVITFLTELQMWS